MSKLVKKTSAILLVIVFIISGLTSVSAELAEDNDTVNTAEENETIERVIYRCGPNGITPVTINLKVKKGATLDEIEEQLED